MTDSISIPIRLSQDLLSTAKRASAKMNMSNQEVIRLALKIGLAQLESIDFDLAGAVLNRNSAKGAEIGEEASE